jgi:outer membrane lipoprotein carrier protein
MPLSPLQVPPRRGIRSLSTALPALALALWAGWAGAAGGLDGKERLDAYLKGLGSLQSSFAQVTFNADRTRMSESRGTFYLSRPGKFRWEYQSPVRQVIVADGKRVYLHDLDLDQVSHQSQAKALRGTPALLLTETGPIERDFAARPIESRDGRAWVELTPKAADSEVVRIELGFGAEGLDSLIMEDSFGQTTRLDFADTRRNPRLDPKLFQVDEKAVEDLLSFD